MRIRAAVITKQYKLRRPSEHRVEPPFPAAGTRGLFAHMVEGSGLYLCCKCAPKHEKFEFLKHLLGSMLQNVNKPAKLPITIVSTVRYRYNGNKERYFYLYEIQFSK